MEVATETSLFASAELGVTTIVLAEPDITTQEMAADTGQSLAQIRAALHRIKSAGNLVVGRGYREDLSGIQRQVPVYKLRG